MIPLRDDAPRFTAPGITWFLIALNTLIFLYELSLPPHLREVFLRQFGVTPILFTHSGTVPWFTLISSMFLHGSWLHLISNMWVLYIFGDNVEDHLGHFRYLLFYFGCGIAASALQILLSANSRIPSVGASGAIAGVMGAYFLLFPAARVLTWVPFLVVFFLWLPAWIVLGYWFIVQFLSGAATSIGSTASTLHGGGIAFWAHVGGFAAGLLLAKLLPARHTHFRI
ncbi:MAG: rhomboid family intramembrane serine protease [Acidobacteriaceae bacterium]